MARTVVLSFASIAIMASLALACGSASDSQEPAPETATGNPVAESPATDPQPADNARNVCGAVGDYTAATATIDGRLLVDKTDFTLRAGAQIEGAAKLVLTQSVCVNALLDAAGKATRITVSTKPLDAPTGSSSSSGGGGGGHGPKPCYKDCPEPPDGGSSSGGSSSGGSSSGGSSSGGSSSGGSSSGGSSSGGSSSGGSSSGGCPSGHCGGGSSSGGSSSGGSSSGGCAHCGH